MHGSEGGSDTKSDGGQTTSNEASTLDKAGSALEIAAAEADDGEGGEAIKVVLSQPNWN